jgi:hypothetical protein
MGCQREGSNFPFLDHRFFIVGELREELVNPSSNIIFSRRGSRKKG